MFISICRRVLEVVEAEVVEEEAWDTEEEEAWVSDEGEVDGAEDTMAAPEEVFSTTQPISKITTRLMSTFIQRRPPTQPVSTTICDGSLATDKPINRNKRK